MHFASLHNQKKDNNKLKNKYQPEVPDTEAYGSLTTKELKKKHSGWWEGWRGLVARWLANQVSEIAAGRPGGPTFACE